MGYDEENLEPKPRKHIKKNLDLKIQSENEMKNSLSIEKKQSTLKSYCVIFDKDKREICAYSLEDLIKNIKDKFKIEEHNSLRVEYWSNVFSEWILLENLPNTNSKVKISIIESTLPKQPLLTMEADEKNIEKSNELVLEQKQQEFFKEWSNNLNLTFKKFIDSEENGEFLNNFETAVIFVIKRTQQGQIQNLEEINFKLLDHGEVIKALNEEVKKIKNSQKACKTQLDQVDEKLSELELQKNEFQFKIKNKRKNFCILS